MTDELTILALYGLLVAFTLILQASHAMQQLGMGYLLSSRDENRTVQGMAARLERALNNSVTALALFAPAVLILHAKDGFSSTTLTAAQIFLVARLIYLPAYVFRITGLRTGVWLLAFAATVLLYLIAIGTT